MITAFGRDEINLKITDLLNKNNIDLYKEEKIYSENENVMKLIENINYINNNHNNNNNLNNSMDQSFISNNNQNELENYESESIENNKNNDEILNNLTINQVNSNRPLKDEKKNKYKTNVTKRYKNHSSKDLEKIMEISSEITNSVKEIPVVEDQKNNINEDFPQKNKKKKKGILRSPDKKKQNQKIRKKQH